MLTNLPSWVAVMTYSNAELTVARHFREASPAIECYLPMLANRDRQIYQVRAVKGVLGIVSSQHNIVQVPDRDIEAVRLFEATQRKFFLTETQSLTKGSHVVILNGEFAGMEGTLLKGSKEGNFSVNINVLNLSFVTHIKRSELKLAPSNIDATL